MSRSELIALCRPRLCSGLLLLLDGVHPLPQGSDLVSKIAHLVGQGLIGRLYDRPLPHETPVSGDARDVSVGHELAHGTLSGRDGDFESLRELANGRQAVLGLQPSRLDIPDQLISDGSVRVPCTG